VLACSAAIIVVWIGFMFVYGKDRMETRVYSKVRTWAAEKTFSGMRAYGMDFGAFGFYTGMTVLDEPGLVWPRASLYQHDLKTILLAEQPEYAYVTANRDNVEAMRSASLSSLYAPLWRASFYGQTDTSAPIESFVTDWAPDFILFERQDLHAAH
jgi:hypothetical protein